MTSRTHNFVALATGMRGLTILALAGGLFGTFAGQVAAGELDTTAIAQTGQATVSARCTTQTPNYYQTVYESSDKSYRLFLNTTLGTGGGGCVSKDYKLAMFGATGNTLLDQWSGTMPGSTPANLPNVANTSALDVMDVPADKSVRMLWLSVSP